MQDKLLVALIISIIYIIFKFMDMRFVQKDNKTPPKMLLKESVYSFVLFRWFIFGRIFDFFQKLCQKLKLAFLDEPNF